MVNQIPTKDKSLTVEEENGHLITDSKMAFDNLENLDSVADGKGL